MSGILILTATDSVQHPSGRGSSSEFVPVLVGAVRADIVDALFIETHEDPDNAPSDGPNVVAATEMRRLSAVPSTAD